jgi:hypothetical protein
MELAMGDVIRFKSAAELALQLFVQKASLEKTWQVPDETFIDAEHSNIQLRWFSKQWPRSFTVDIGYTARPPEPWQPNVGHCEILDYFRDGECDGTRREHVFHIEGSFPNPFIVANVMNEFARMFERFLREETELITENEDNMDY